MKTKFYISFWAIGICFLAFLIIRENIFSDNKIISIELENQDPYCIFGNDGVLLMTELERRKEHKLEIENKDEKNFLHKLELNTQTGIVTLLDKDGNIISERLLASEEQARWIAIDPLAEDYSSTNPYAYCLNNPMKFIDPDGKSTWTMLNEDGTYRVVGGNMEDGNRNIYILNSMMDILSLAFGYNPEKILGETMTMTSFYDSEEKKWLGTIDPLDRSGMDFINDFTKHTPGLLEYMSAAGNTGEYDFKHQGYVESKVSVGEYYYRGMPFAASGNGSTVYASARDIGNFAAGYVAAVRGLPWNITRLGFDAYESKQRGKIKMEGLSTRNAQWVGYCHGMYNWKK